MLFDRFDERITRGLILLITVIVLLAVGFLSKTDQIISAEQDFSSWIYQNTSDTVRQIFSVITYGGSYYLQVPVCLVLIINPKTREFGIIVLVIILLTILFADLIFKNLVQRLRPSIYLDIEPITHFSSKYGFLSGHTAILFAISYQIFVKYGKYALIAFVFAIVVGFSRIVLLAHFPGDVICGAILGISIGIFQPQVSDLMKTYIPFLRD